MEKGCVRLCSYLLIIKRKLATTGALQRSCKQEKTENSRKFDKFHKALECDVSSQRQ